MSLYLANERHACQVFCVTRETYRYQSSLYPLVRLDQQSDLLFGPQYGLEAKPVQALRSHRDAVIESFETPHPCGLSWAFQIAEVPPSTDNSTPFT
jgi:hypothetical protein